MLLTVEPSFQPLFWRCITFLGCHKKVSQIEWLRTIEINSFKVLETRCCKVRVFTQPCSVWGYREELFFVVVYCVCVVFRDRISLCGLGCLGTHFVNQVGLPASLSAGITGRRGPAWKSHFLCFSTLWSLLPVLSFLWLVAASVIVACLHMGNSLLCFYIPISLIKYTIQGAH